MRQAIDEVYAGLKTPKEALDDATEKSAKSLVGRNEVGYLRKNDFRKYNKASTDW